MKINKNTMIGLIPILIGAVVLYLLSKAKPASLLPITISGTTSLETPMLLGMLRSVIQA